MKIEKHRFDTVYSTNTWAKENAHTFSADSMTLITANQQTAGRGRFKREWHSPPTENIYTTYCFFVDNQRTDIGNIPQILAIATAETLEALGFKPALKWPNDVLLSEKKVAGILCETTPLDQLCVILGIGLNVNMSKEELGHIDRPATSLAVERQGHFDVKTVLDLLTENFQKFLVEFLEKGFTPFLPKYKRLLWVPEDKKIRFHDNQNVWEGEFQTINDDGTLSLKLENGTIKVFMAGEIL